MQRELERFREEEALRVALAASVRDVESTPTRVDSTPGAQQQQILTTSFQQPHLNDEELSNNNNTNKRNRRRRNRRDRLTLEEEENEVAGMPREETDKEIEVAVENTAESRGNVGREDVKDQVKEDHRDEEPRLVSSQERKRGSMEALETKPISPESQKLLKHHHADKTQGEEKVKSKTSKEEEEEEEEEVVVLIPPLPNDVVLGIIIARYVDEDTLHNVLPQISRLWRRSILVEANQLLWKRLCLERAWRQWVEWGFLTVNALCSLRPPDFKRAYWMRKRIRESGPYYFRHIYWKPVQRSMWTPKDVNPVILCQHYRLLWFAPQNRVLYASTAQLQQLEVLIDLMRSVRKTTSSFNNSLNNTLNFGGGGGGGGGGCVENGDHQIFWWGSYQVHREGNGDLVALVHVPMRRHQVKLELGLDRGGRVLHWKTLSSAPLSRPWDQVMHEIPGTEGAIDREFWFKSGFLG